MSPRQIHLAAFLIAGNAAHSHALWRHPQSQGHFLEADYYGHLGTILERGKFDLVFFADRLAVADRFSRTFEVGLQHGDQDATRLDPALVLAAMTPTTRHLGLGATCSTTYSQPYHVARTFATLDHLSRGRAAWNVVTSMNDAEANNFGVAAHGEHDQRYDRADEFMEVVCQLWNSWDADALVLDKVAGVYADPQKVHYINHTGRWFQSRGPLNIPRSPQGRPVIIQAGSSGRGRTFAARWADVVFSIQPTPERMQAFYRDLKTTVSQQGRDPDHCLILTAVMPFVATTEAEAKQHQALHNELVDPLAGLSTLSSHANYDFSRHPLNGLLTPLVSGGSQGMLDTVVQVSQQQGLTLQEVGQVYGQSVLVPQIVGTPSQVADQLEHLFQTQACDGFVISPAHLPGTFADFVDQVIPLWQHRHLFRQQYDGPHLRHQLGLPDPNPR